MRFFKLSIRENIKNFTDSEHGWKYSFRHVSKFGFVSLKTPKIKEVTESKGGSVQYVKHYTYCLGLMGKSSFYGIAIFDWPIRLLFLSLSFCGGFYGYDSLIAGFLMSFLFYLILSFISVDDDDLMMSLIKRKMQ